MERKHPHDEARRALVLGSLATGAVFASSSVDASDARGSAVYAPSGQQRIGDTAQTEPNNTPRGRPGAGSSLAGKIAVVTGAARGIGRAIAVEFAANGADVVAMDICGPASVQTLYPHSTRADLDETETLVTAHGRRFLPIVVDVRDLGALRRAAETASQKVGQIHIVVADAGVQIFKPLLEMNDADWHDPIDINLNGTANTLRAFAPYLVKGAGGRIIVVASMQGRYGTMNGSSYSASKWGLIGLMKSAALELGKYKITVNAVVPGLVDTPMTRNEMRWKLAIAADSERHVDHPTEAEAIAALSPHLPLGIPWLKPEKIAGAAVFLASDSADMVTGATFEVTGGDSAHDTA